MSISLWHSQGCKAFWKQNRKMENKSNSTFLKRKKRKTCCPIPANIEDEEKKTKEPFTSHLYAWVKVGPPSFPCFPKEGSFQIVFTDWLCCRDAASFYSIEKYFFSIITQFENNVFLAIEQSFWSRDQVVLWSGLPVLTIVFSCIRSQSERASLSCKWWEKNKLFALIHNQSNSKRGFSA